MKGGAAADDSGVRASKIISEYNFFGILTAKADASLGHVDKSFLIIATIFI